MTKSAGNIVSPVQITKLQLNVVARYLDKLNESLNEQRTLRYWLNKIFQLIINPTCRTFLKSHYRIFSNVFNSYVIIF